MSTGVQRESAEPDNSTVTAKVNCWGQMREPLGELTASRSHDHDRFAVTLDHDRLAATHKIRLLCVDKRATASARWTEPAPTIPVIRIAKPLQPYHFIETGQRSMRRRAIE